MEYTIYVITNEVNGKEYVGVTSDLDRRWRGHKGRASRGYDGHLYNAMRKHGADQFSIKPVEQAGGKEQAYELEKQWIADLDTYHGEGYNMTEGGDYPPVLTGEDNPMYGRTGEDAPMYGRTGEDNPMYGRGDLISGEDAPFYGVTGEDHPGSKLTGDNNPMYGRTGEDAPMYGIRGEDHPGSKLTGDNNPMYGRTGEGNPNSKLSNEDASTVKWYALYTNLSNIEIGEIFKVSNSTVSKIRRGKRYPNVAPKSPADNGQLRLPLGAT